MILLQGAPLSSSLTNGDLVLDQPQIIIWLLS